MGENDSFRLIEQDMASTFLVILAFVGFVFYANEAKAGDFYFGGGIGRAMHTRSYCPTGFHCSYRPDGFKVFAGYQLDPTFSVELTYADLGKMSRIRDFSAPSAWPAFNDAGAWADARGFDISGLFYSPHWHKFQLFGRIGLHDLDMRVGFPVGGPVTATQSSVGPTFGLGVTYELNKTFSLRAEAQRWDRIGGGLVGGERHWQLSTLSIVVAFPK